MKLHWNPALGWAVPCRKGAPAVCWAPFPGAGVGRVDKDPCLLAAALLEPTGRKLLPMYDGITKAQELRH